MAEITMNNDHTKELRARPLVSVPTTWWLLATAIADPKTNSADKITAAEVLANLILTDEDPN